MFRRGLCCVSHRGCACTPRRECGPLPRSVARAMGRQKREIWQVTTGRHSAQLEPSRTEETHFIMHQASGISRVHTITQQQKQQQRYNRPAARGHSGSSATTSSSKMTGVLCRCTHGSSSGSIPPLATESSPTTNVLLCHWLQRMFYAHDVCITLSLEASDYTWQPNNSKSSKTLSLFGRSRTVHVYVPMCAISCRRTYTGGASEHIRRTYCSNT